jgi:hypothetical protein
MKTKPNTKSKTFIAFAAIFCCIISLNSFGQNPIIPTAQDFAGTWSGATASGNETVQITLTSNWKCEFMVNGAPSNSVNPVIAYRLPQYFPAAITQNGPPASPEITIKFYTQNAVAGVRVPTNTPNTSSPAGDIPVVPTMMEQVYTGVAVLAVNNTGNYEMTLYLDPANYHENPPSASSPDASTPYCVLVRQ